MVLLVNKLFGLSEVLIICTILILLQLAQDKDYNTNLKQLIYTLSKQFLQRFIKKKTKKKKSYDGCIMNNVVYCSYSKMCPLKLSKMALILKCLTSE